MTTLFFNRKLAVILLCIFGFLSSNVQAGQPFESVTPVVVKPLTANQAGVIRIYPLGRTNCTKCFGELSYTEKTIINVVGSGKKVSISPFGLHTIKLKKADVIVYEEGIVGTIDLYK